MLVQHLKNFELKLFYIVSVIEPKRSKIMHSNEGILGHVVAPKFCYNGILQRNNGKMTIK